MIKIIKAHREIVTKQRPLSYKDERASVDFRAFYAVANVHVNRVRDPKVKDVMLEVLDNLRNSLRSIQ